MESLTKPRAQPPDNKTIKIILDPQTPSYKMPTSKLPFNRFILNNHQKKNNLNQETLDAISKTQPEKTVACQRCRRLRKKCSKHYPSCFTCAKMGEDCEYVEKQPYKRKYKEDTEISTDVSSRSSVNDSGNDQNSTIHDNLMSTGLNQPKVMQLESKPNYTYQDHIHTGVRSLSIPNIQLSAEGYRQIKLPSISINSQNDQSKSQTMAKQNRIPNVSSDGSKVEIQNAILSTLINLGKQNFQKTASQENLVISKEEALRYSKSYFEKFYHLFPFIHKGQFYKEFEDLNLYNLLYPSFATPTVQQKRNFQIFLILNIGFKDLHNSNSLSPAEIEQNGPIFNTSKIHDSIQSSLTFNSIDDIKVLTLLVIDSFYTKNCLTTTNLTNILTGLALRYNLHRKLSKARADEFSLFGIEMRYRLFWSIYIIDRTVSVYLNKLIAIPDEYINLPYPIYWNDFDSDSGVTGKCFNDLNFQLVLELKKLEGSIHKEVHSVLAINNKTPEENKDIIKGLSNRIESWYLKTTTSSGKHPLGGKSDHSSNGNNSIWYTTNYYNCLTLLYKHSYLNPVLSGELLEKLSKAVLQNLSYSYNSTINKSSFSINWMSFFRILIILKTLLKCFVTGNIDVYDSKTELNLCIELLKNYVNENNDWLFVYDIIEIFENILKISFYENSSSEEVRELLKKYETQLNKVLKTNSVGCRLDHKIEDEYNLEDRIDEEYNLR